MASRTDRDPRSTDLLHPCDNPWIPEGFVTMVGPDDQRYLVPEFMVPGMHQLVQGNQKKKELNVAGASGSVSSTFPMELLDKKLFDVVGEGKLMAPSVPVCTIDRERLSAHGEVLVLQERLGISYKDAAHRLYMCELEKIKTDQRMYKAFMNFQQSGEKTLEMAYKSVKIIEATGPEDHTGL
ncbi:hypothetical protein BYT27DRAFT_7120018 [Phlegmacium glaucopus]|nr:hypothetical protein BYT27DRAFT_7120018 [Phlegmacium glaucopus]